MGCMFPDVPFAKGEARWRLAQYSHSSPLKREEERSTGAEIQIMLCSHWTYTFSYRSFIFSFSLCFGLPLKITLQFVLLMLGMLMTWLMELSHWCLWIRFFQWIPHWQDTLTTASSGFWTWVGAFTCVSIYMLLHCERFKYLCRRDVA